MLKKLYKKALFSLKLFFYSLMYGIKNANDLLTRQGGNDNDNGNDNDGPDNDGPDNDGPDNDGPDDD